MKMDVFVEPASRRFPSDTFLAFLSILGSIWEPIGAQKWLFGAPEVVSFFDRFLLKKGYLEEGVPPPLKKKVKRS